MRIRATAAMAAALLLANFGASASEWIDVVQSKDGTTLQIDVSSIRIEGAIRRAWLKSVPPSHTMKKRHGDYSLMRVAFNCLIGSHTVNLDILAKLEKWDPIPPDTALSSGMQFVCLWKPK
jgi:hypothetical protein